MGMGVGDRPLTLPVLWALAVAGWLTVAAGLARGLTGTARTASLTAHALTPFGVLFTASLLGFGALYAVIAMTAQWWALVLVTLLRPERLADPPGDGTLRLAAWLATTAALAWALTTLIL